MSMKCITKKMKRIWALLLSVVVFITGIPAPAFAENHISSYLDGWTVQAAWSNLSTEYVWNAAEEEVRQPKLVVTYRMDHAEKTYPAGSLTFSVPGIGAANRAEIVKASQLAADESDSEWSYSWNQEQDLYTFTNKFEVTEGQTVSGGFELLWSLNSRNLENGFEQSRSPEFLVEGIGSVTLKPIVFRFSSVRDRYRIDFSKDKLYDEAYESADSDYVWYEFTTRFDKDWMARGLYKSDFYVAVELPEDQDYEDVVVQYSGETLELSQDEHGNWGFYPFQNRSGDLGGHYYSHYEYFTLGFKKETLTGQEVTVHGHLDRLYQDEAQWITEAGANEIVDDELTFTVEEYHFAYTGYIYDHDQWNRSYENYSKAPNYYTFTYGDELSHQAPPKYMDRLNAVNLYNGKIVQFILRGKANRTYAAEAAAYGLRGRAATPSNADDVSAVAVTSEWEEISLPETLEDWNDIHWQENGRMAEAAELTGVTYEERHSEQIATLSNAKQASGSDAELASDSNADEEDEDDWDIGEIFLIPDIFISSVKNLFRLTAYAAEATPSNAASSDAVKAAVMAVDEQETAAQGIYISQIGEDQEYSMVLGDDKLAIFLNDGSIRELEDHEYDIAYVTVPGDGEGHGYEIYGASSQDTAFEEYVLVGTGSTESLQTCHLPDGVKAVFVRINGIKGTYTNYAYVGVRLHLDWNEQQELNADKRPDHENRLVNFSYMRALYVDEDGYEKNDCVVDSDNYEGTYGEELAQMDEALYGEYLQRDYSNVWLRSAVTTLSASVSLTELTGENRSGFSSEITSGGTIQADSEGSLERFSVYTVLPDGLHTDIDEARIVIQGSAYDSSGKEVTDLSDYAVISAGELNGKMMIAANFDCSDCPLQISEKTCVSVTIPVTLSYADYLNYGNRYTVKSYVMVHDDGIDRIDGMAVMGDEYDMDQDGNTSEKVAYAVNHETVLDQVNEWREYVSKSVKSAYSDDYETETVTRVYVETDSEEERKKSDYSYRLEFGLGSDNARNIVFFDRLEQGAFLEVDTGTESTVQQIKSQWQGQLVSVDTSYAEQMGMVPVIYYSMDEAQEYDLSASGWVTELPENPGLVKSIAVSLSTDAMDGGMMKTHQMVYVTIHMRAPSDVTLCDKKAVNQYAVQYDAYGLEDSFEKTYLLTSSETRVRLLDTVGKIVLQKVDADRLVRTDADGTKHYAALTGARFQVYDSAGNPLFTEPKSLSSLGRIVVKNVPYGTYYWEEVDAPVGYQKITGRHVFEIDGITETLEIENRRIPGTVILTKEDKDSETQKRLAGAVYELYQANGDQVFADGDGIYSETGANSRFTTGASGQLQISGLPWGSYYFVEITAPTGYKLDSDPVYFSLGTGQYDEETDTVAVHVTAYNEQKTASITLQKSDAESGGAIKDAVYSLYQVSTEGEKELSSGLKTNAAGEIIVTDLKFGTYYFTETRNAGGYLMPEGEEARTESVVLDASTAGKMVEVGHTNERRTGSVNMTKTDDAGQLVGGAEYALYYKDENDGEYTLFGSYVTQDEKNAADYGEISVDQLPWGMYYFIETKAPKGYELSAEQIAFIVDRDTVQNLIYLTTVDQRKAGSVKLIKTDKNNQDLCLQGAVFELYRTDGSRCMAGVDYELPEGAASIVTGADGSITLTGIKQGGYYFQEIKAPDSYSISDEQIRFSITKENADVVQELVAVNEKGKAVITIHKEINEMYEAFGNPTFLFRISGTDGSTYVKSITLGSQNLAGSVSVEVEQGAVYTVTELPTARYRLEEVIPGVHASLCEDRSCAELDLVTNTESEVTFINRMDLYEKFSHTSHANNIVRDVTKLTAISAEYLGDDPITTSSDGYDEDWETYTLSKSDLLVTAYYDDGTSAEICAEDYTLSPETADGNSDSYTGMVTYTEDGITRMASFSVGIELPVPSPKYTVSYELNGGTIIPDGETSVQDTYSYVVKSGTQIEQPENEPVLEGWKFCGWYADRSFQTEAVFPDIITSDKKYYAKWEEICIRINYAVSIYGIAEDTDENGNPVGLTFGPATGESYLDSSKSHTPVKDGQMCMHDMSWDEIILQSRTDPSVFQECLENGCTHAVPLKIREPLMGTASIPDMSGDGVGVLYYSISETYREWNHDHSTYFTDTDSYEYRYGCNVGGWPDSAVRNTLNGTVTEDMLAVSNKDNGFAETKLSASTALISAFPEELRDAIVAKKVRSDTVYNNTSDYNEITYDKLWLFSGIELISDTGSGSGSKAIRPNEGTRYSRQDVMGITTSTASPNVAYCEDGDTFNRWTRSMYPSRIAAYNVFGADGGGFLVSNTAHTQYGLSPGFCLPGPESD